MGKFARIQELQKLLKKKGLDALWVTHQPDLNFLTDFPMEGYALLVGRRKVWAFMPLLLKDQFNRVVPGCTVGLNTEIMKMLKSLKAGLNGKMSAHIAFDPEHENYQSGKALKKLQLIEHPGLVGDLRTVKKGGELGRVARACSITAQAFQILRPRIRSGRTEISIAKELEDTMRRLGADSLAFDLIVASGPNSALPHHISSERRILKNEAVVIDFGCTYRLYRSDMTRTVFTGVPKGLFSRVYSIVEKSQRAGIAAVRPGIPAGEVDRASREVIEAEGFGPRFIHSTGHGVGLDIHERPRVGPKSKEKLEAGMVITVEPGIYLPGKFGVRIEDTLLVTRRGSKILTWHDRSTARSGARKWLSRAGEYHGKS